MSPKRGDRVTVPALDGQWEVRFGTTDAVRGWEELCRLALPNTRRCFDALRDHPRSHVIPTASTGFVAISGSTGTTAPTSSSGNTRSPAADGSAM